MTTAGFLLQRSGLGAALGSVTRLELPPELRCYSVPTCCCEDEADDEREAGTAHVHVGAQCSWEERLEGRGIPAQSLQELHEYASPGDEQREELLPATATSSTAAAALASIAVVSYSGTVVPLGAACADRHGMIHISTAEDEVARPHDAEDRRSGEDSEEVDDGFDDVDTEVPSDSRGYLDAPDDLLVDSETDECPSVGSASEARLPIATVPQAVGAGLCLGPASNTAGHVPSSAACLDFRSNAPASAWSGRLSLGKSVGSSGLIAHLEYDGTSGAFVATCERDRFEGFQEVGTLSDVDDVTI